MVIGKLKQKKGKDNEEIFVGNIAITDMEACETLDKSIVEAASGKRYLKIIVVPCEEDEHKNTHLIKTCLIHEKAK